MIVYLSGNVKFKLLFKVFQFVCVLSHGQGSIERGFNINKDILIENLSQESLIGQRIMYDHIKLHNFPITMEMILSCKMVYPKYSQAQEKKKVSTESVKKANKRKLKEEEIISAKRKKLDLDKAIEELQADIDESSVLALAKEDYESMKLCLEKGQNNKLLLQEKKSQPAALDEEFKMLEEEARKL